MPWVRNPVVRFGTTLRREAVICGLLGGVVVAGFYFLVDLARGHPLMTPSVLGQVFIYHEPITATAEPGPVVAYTIVHWLAFIGFGFVLTALARYGERGALARYAVVQLLVVFEVFFYGLLSVASEQARGLFPFVGVLAANTLAVGAMIAWEWRHHPLFRAAFLNEPLGACDGAARPAVVRRSA